MHAHDYRDIIAGGVLVLLGAAVTFHAATSLELGTLMRLGSGGFPAALGLLLVGFGVALGAPAVARRGDLPQVAVVPAVAVLASMLVFALLLRPLGIAPAVFVMTMVATQADRKLGLVKSAALAAFLAIIAALIFPIGLGIRVPVFSWDW